MSGLPFAGSDVGGYSGQGDAGPELFARWMSLGSVSPLFRAHAASTARRQEPWAFGDEVEDAAREAIGLRYELLPYLYALFHEAHVAGAPVLRPLVFDFQDDPRVATVADEAMLGPFLLAAPLVVPGAQTRSVVLPEGRWVDLRSGAAYEGGTVTLSTAPYPTPLSALPLLLREGAIVPRGPRVQWTGERPLSPLVLEAFPGPVPSRFTTYEDAGDGFDAGHGGYAEVTYTLARTPYGARLTASDRRGRYAPPERMLLVRFRRVDRDARAVSSDGAPLARVADEAILLAAGEGYVWDASDLTLLVAVKDRAPLVLDVAYDPAPVVPEPPVTMPVVVHVPRGTPPAPPVSIATSANGWSHASLAPTADPTVWTGHVTAPRGAWVFHKFARGSWATVEKSASCAEVPNRSVLAAAHPAAPGNATAPLSGGIEATVAAWADACPR
jgi:alpha-glucosidase